MDKSRKRSINLFAQIERTTSTNTRFRLSKCPHRHSSRMINGPITTECLSACIQQKRFPCQASSSLSAHHYVWVCFSLRNGLPQQESSTVPRTEFRRYYIIPFGIYSASLSSLAYFTKPSHLHPYSAFSFIGNWWLGLPPRRTLRVTFLPWTDARQRRLLNNSINTNRSQTTKLAPCVALASVRLM